MKLPEVHPVSYLVRRNRTWLERIKGRRSRRRIQNNLRWMRRLDEQARRDC